MSTYEASGVDLEAAADHVAAIADAVTSTWTNAVVGGFGGFAAGVEVPPSVKAPVVMASTDGVGTKLEVARQLDHWAGVGYDLVAMCVDDLVVAGAHPIGFTDYLATGALNGPRDSAIVNSIAGACRSAAIPLLGGETAEHPGTMAPDQVDVAGTAIGVVERGQELTGSDIRAGDRLIGLASPNVRSNGFSLVRSIVSDFSAPFGEHTIGDELLEPSVIYAPTVAKVLPLLQGAAHITGGGIADNVARVLPDRVDAIVDIEAWARPPIFSALADLGRVSPEEMFSVFNMGVGMVLVVRPEDVTQVLNRVNEFDATVIGATVIGAIEDGGGHVRMSPLT